MVQPDVVWHRQLCALKTPPGLLPGCQNPNPRRLLHTFVVAFAGIDIVDGDEEEEEEEVSCVRVLSRGAGQWMVDTQHGTGLRAVCFASAWHNR
jgi:hypothetical protein